MLVLADGIGNSVRTVHSCHDETDLSGVGGTCKVCVDLLGLMLIQRNETVQDVVACRRIIRSTFSNIRLLMRTAVSSILVQLAFIVREIVLHWRHRQFFLESVDLIQEEND